MVQLLWIFLGALFHLTVGFQGYFWDICDLHLNISNLNYSLENLGNYKSDSTILLMKSALIEMKSIYSNPEFIIVNGDNMFHGDAKFNETIVMVSNEIFNIFSSAIVIPSLGNHDIMPRNVIQNYSPWCNVWYNIWEKYLNNLDPVEIENAKKGCFYSRTIQSKNGNVLVVVLNTLLWYTRNRLTLNQLDPNDQFKWLEQRIQYAKNMKIKIFLVGHIPPGTSEYSSIIIEHLHSNFNSRLVDIMQSNYETIHAGIFAHQHSDAFKVVYNKTNKPVVPIFLAPSVTPFRLSTIGSVNPSFRLYKWSTTAENSSYDQYHAILPSSNEKQILAWTKEYSSLEFVPGISAGHLAKLLSDFASKNSTYFNKFFSYHLSGQPHDNAACPYDSQCRHQFICSMKYVDYPAFYSCWKQYSRGVALLFKIEISLILNVILFIKLFFQDS